MEVTREKLLFFCSRLGGGGAEMHLVRIINELPFDQYEVHLALTRPGGGYEDQLDKRVEVHYLSDSQSSTAALIKSWRPLRKAVRTIRPTHVISVMDRQNILASAVKFFAGKRFRSKLILCCQVAPSKDLSADRVGRWIAGRIPFFYNKADKIIAISKGVREDLINNHRVRIPVDVVYNAGWDLSLKDRLDEEVDVVKAPMQFVACGRLTGQKGFDILLDSIALMPKDIEFNCWIIGEGKDRGMLENKVGELKISERVSFLGFRKNPFKYFAAADAFVLSSRWEGFGNVIVEAMACRTPVVSTDCDYGPGEIITHGESGWLVPVEDAEKLSEGMARLASDEELRRSLAESGLKRADHFIASRISAEYLKSILTS